jgi:nucleotide-binding universal stress UspA family protein
MAYTALMVYFDATPSAHARLRLAVDLADRFRATLIGIAGPPYLPSSELGMVDALGKIELEFRAGAKRIQTVEWRGRPVWAGVLVPEEARAADLVVIGRASRSWEMFDANDPATIILRAGRPVLFVPDGVDSLVAQRIVIAWKDSREARRAVKDALPFLKLAKEIAIVAVNQDSVRSQGEFDDIGNYLLRHGVIMGIKAQLDTKGPSSAEILGFAHKEKADLIVAGGYGRSELGEWVFGGVTRDLLNTSPLCCLFSH